MIRTHQDGYHAALQASREPDIDAAVFIDSMFGVITESLEAYEARARVRFTHVGASVGANVGVSHSIVELLRLEPTLSAAALAARLGTSTRTVERHLAELKRAGRLRRDGSDKAGRWAVIDQVPR